MIPDRRTRRSADIQDALTLLFETVARRCGAAELALATATGVPLAAKPTTASFVERRPRGARAETAVVPLPTSFRHGGQPLMLWARGARGTARAAISEASTGLLRILDGQF